MKWKRALTSERAKWRNTKRETESAKWIREAMRERVVVKNGGIGQRLGLGKMAGKTRGAMIQCCEGVRGPLNLTGLNVMGLTSWPKRSMLSLNFESPMLNFMWFIYFSIEGKGKTTTSTSPLKLWIVSHLVFQNKIWLIDSLNSKLLFCCSMHLPFKMQLYLYLN